VKKWRWVIFTGIFLAVAAALINRYRVMKNLAKIQLEKNFNLSEFVRTNTGLDNIPGETEIENLRKLCVYILQPLRDYLTKKYPHLKIVINITSGYRSDAVNTKIKGSKTSDHRFGKAGDFNVPGLTNQQIIDAVIELQLPIDQVIDEQLWKYDSLGNLYLSKWVHISYNADRHRRQWKTARNTKTALDPVYTLIKLIA
jgi:zinc D-Ala-D-Ala carboxypeptidase